MTFNCSFETPCGWCEKFDASCKEVCKMPKNDRFQSTMKVSHNTTTKQEAEIDHLDIDKDNRAIIRPVDYMS